MSGPDPGRRQAISSSILSHGVSHVYEQEKNIPILEMLIPRLKDQLSGKRKTSQTDLLFSALILGESIQMTQEGYENLLKAIRDQDSRSEEKRGRTTNKAMRSIVAEDSNLTWEVSNDELSLAFRDGLKHPLPGFCDYCDFIAKICVRKGLEFKDGFSVFGGVIGHNHVYSGKNPFYGRTDLNGCVKTNTYESYGFTFRDVGRCTRPKKSTPTCQLKKQYEHKELMKSFEKPEMVKSVGLDVEQIEQDALLDSDDEVLSEPGCASPVYRPTSPFPRPSTSKIVRFVDKGKTSALRPAPKRLRCTSPMQQDPPPRQTTAAGVIPFIEIVERVPSP